MNAFYALAGAANGNLISLIVYAFVALSLWPLQIASV